MRNLYIICLFSFVFQSAHSFTRAREAPIKECNNKEIYQNFKECFETREKASHAFSMLHRDSNNIVIKTKYIAILAHGLSDSPYFYRDIGEILFKEGINVFAYRNSGHGTHFSDLKKATRFQWYEDLEWAKEVSKKYGEKIILGGMSLGGALAVREALNSETNIEGVMLFSPVASMIFRTRLTCFYKKGYQAEKTYGVGVRYPKISNSGTCEADKITKEIKGFLQTRKKRFSKIKIPMFSVLSVFDTVVHLKDTYKLSKHINADSHLLLYTNIDKTDAKGNDLNLKLFPKKTRMAEVEQMKHASVLLKESDNDLTPEINHRFEVLEKELKKFVRYNFR